MRVRIWWFVHRALTRLTLEIECRFLPAHLWPMHEEPRRSRITSVRKDW